MHVILSAPSPSLAAKLVGQILSIIISTMRLSESGAACTFLGEAFIGEPDPLETAPGPVEVLLTGVPVPFLATPIPEVCLVGTPAAGDPPDAVVDTVVEEPAAYFFAFIFFLYS